MLLFTVEERFMITGRGLVLVPGLGNKMAKIGDKIKIVRPDQSTIEKIIQGISFNEFRDILVDPGLTKEDVPIGSEVWLND
jgi:translation elongation factor EF-Tu-like GTPase